MSAILPSSSSSRSVASSGTTHREERSKAHPMSTMYTYTDPEPSKKERLVSYLLLSLHCATLILSVLALLTPNTVFETTGGIAVVNLNITALQALQNSNYNLSAAGGLNTSSNSTLGLATNGSASTSTSNTTTMSTKQATNTTTTLAVDPASISSRASVGSTDTKQTSTSTSIPPATSTPINESDKTQTLVVNTPSSTASSTAAQSLNRIAKRAVPRRRVLSSSGSSSHR